MQNDQSGVVLIFVAVVLVALLGLCGIALDVSMLLYSARTAQSAVDAAARAGVDQMIRAGDTPLSIDAYKDVKRAILASLADSHIHGMNAEAKNAFTGQNVRYKSGTSTGPDWKLYTTDIARAGNLEIKVRRGIYCYTNAPALKRLWVDLEDGKHFCHARSVRVDLKVESFQTHFMQIVGISRKPDVAVFASANLVSGCGTPSCSSLGIDDNGVIKTTPNCI